MNPEPRRAGWEACIWDCAANLPQLDTETRARCHANASYAAAIAAGRSDAEARGAGLATYTAEGGAHLEAARAAA
jgi:hypothetical protein